jgi:hypothetical protein
MTKAIIHIPAKNAMQSGKAKTKSFWLLEFKPESKKKVDNLMGWQGSADMKQEIRLNFDSKEAAISYAKKNGIEFEVVEPKTPIVKIKSYAENFTN